MAGRGRAKNTDIDWPVVLAEAQAAGLSIQQLADKLGVHRTQINRKEQVTGIRLKRLVDNPERRGKPDFDWVKILTDARDADMNCHQLSDFLGVKNSSVVQAQHRTQIFLPKGKTKFSP